MFEDATVRDGVTTVGAAPNAQAVVENVAIKHRIGGRGACNGAFYLELRHVNSKRSAE